MSTTGTLMHPQFVTGTNKWDTTQPTAGGWCRVELYGEQHASASDDGIARGVGSKETAGRAEEAVLAYICGVGRRCEGAGGRVRYMYDWIAEFAGRSLQFMICIVRYRSVFRSGFETPTARKRTRSDHDGRAGA